jgi:hypothetical protein
VPSFVPTFSRWAEREPGRPRLPNVEAFLFSFSFAVYRLLSLFDETFIAFHFPYLLPFGPTLFHYSISILLSGLAILDLLDLLDLACLLAPIKALVLDDDWEALYGPWAKTV